MSLLGVSILTCAILYGLLAGILAAVFIYTGLPLFWTFAIVIVVIVIQFLIAPFITDLTQKWFYKTNFNPSIPAYLEQFIGQACAAHGVRYPKIGLIDDGAPNAFTYGRTKKDARIVLTRGIFELLDEEEVKAVIAHEIGHIVHYDMAVMTMIQVVPMVFYMVYSIFYDNSPKTSSDNDEKDYGILIGIIAYILYFISEYIILWLSRVREYYADEFSAELTGNAAALSSALINIGLGLSTRAKSEDSLGSASGQSALGIFDAKSSKSLVVECYKDGVIQKDRIKGAMKWELWNPWASLYELGSTHPLISKRVVRLDKLSQQRGGQAFVNFDLVQPESYVDDFALEVLISCMPTVGATAIAIIGLIVGVSSNTASSMFPLTVFGLTCVVAALLSIAKYLFTHPRGEYFRANTAGLLSEVKVSMVRSIPTELTGTIIGRGNPGCIFDENFVIKDDSGILFINYQQPLWILNKYFAFFTNAENFNKQATVKGWYRRGLVPYLELFSYSVDGKEKRLFSYTWGWIWRIALLVFGTVLVLGRFFI